MIKKSHLIIRAYGLRGQKCNCGTPLGRGVYEAFTFADPLTHKGIPTASINTTPPAAPYPMMAPVPLMEGVETDWVSLLVVF